MTGTIAAGEIREYEACGGRHLEIRPYDTWFDNNLVRASVHRDGGATVSSDLMEWSLTPAEARDFARAILAAADWAERQGR
jgi:hypothetical protein